MRRCSCSSSPCRGAQRGTRVRLYSVASTPVGQGRYRTRLAVFRPESDESVFLDCPGLRGTWSKGDRGWNRVVVPQTCLGDGAGRQRLTVVASDARDDGGFFFFFFRQGMRGDDATAVDQLDRTVTVRRGR
ncbi:MAG: hypothetical protein Q7T56_18665 [Nocardioidaceae bacterium]|nr:hypothetical protein [Nocardioidaceae bacterium]